MSSIETSIIIPAYNSAKWIEQTLLSCVKQNAPGVNYEIVVVNDGSTDHTDALLSQVVKQVPSGLLRVFQQDNKGQAAAENLAVANTRGSKILILDSDDLLAPCAINMLGDALRNNALATSEYAAFRDKDSEILYVTHKGEFQTKSDDPDKIPLLHSNVIGAPRMIYRREFELAGGLDESMLCSNDYDLALRIVYPGRDNCWVNIPEVLYWYRRHQVSQSIVKRDLSIKFGEQAVSSALTRLGISKRGIYTGLHPVGYMYFEHKPTI